MRRQKPLSDPRISTVVRRQLGHVTRVQLFALGWTRYDVDHRIDAGELIPVHAGVYAVGHVPRHAHARAMAAVIACGEGAALSHASALALWSAADWPRTLEVTAPKERRRPGITTHRSATLTRADRRTHQGVPVTSPARTISDVHRRLTDARLARVVNDLRVAGHLGPTALADLQARCPRLAALLGDAPGLTRSRLEDDFRAFLRRHGLPMPESNVRLPETGREVDALYRRQRLIIELDSWTHHRSRASFERDRTKDAQALTLGYRTLRLTHRRLTAADASRIRVLLAA